MTVFEKAEMPTTQPPDDVADETVDNWGIHSTRTGSTIIMSTSREGVEMQLRRLAQADPDLRLVRRSVRIRTEKWLGPIETVPWHTPCNWIGAADKDGKPIPGTTRCYAHSHAEGEPVPAEFILGGNGNV